MHDLISPTINFSILVAGLFYFLNKPVRAMIAQRRNSIDTQVREAQELKKQAEKKMAEFTQKLAVFESEAKEVLARAESDANALKEKIIATAHLSAEKIIKDAELTAQANVQEFKDQIRRETIARIVDQAEKMIRERVSSDDQKRIVNEYVGKV